MSNPTKTVPEVLKLQRIVRSADITVALQDFQEMPPDQQTEFLLTNLLVLNKRTVDLEAKLDIIIRMLGR